MSIESSAETGRPAAENGQCLHFAPKIPSARVISIDTTWSANALSNTI